MKELVTESVKDSSLEFDFHGATLRVTDQTSDALLRGCGQFLDLMSKDVRRKK